MTEPFERGALAAAVAAASQRWARPDDREAVADRLPRSILLVGGDVASLATLKA